MRINLNGYKKIYYLENLLREYCLNYSTISDLDPSFKNSLEQTAKDNGELDYNYENLLKYSHIGQLYDFIKSKKFRRIKDNQINSVEITKLISRRNDIMHSRPIEGAEDQFIEEKCTTLIHRLEDEEYSRKWNKFLTEDIKEYRIPLLHLVYPIGKNFKNLIGRSKELADLKREIKFPTPVSIVGHGGLGKTALVLQLIEDYMYSPDFPFENIYFMSFKNTAYENGKIVRFEKAINDHDELILRLASCMEIEDNNSDFKELSNKVWNRIFSQKSLLILDNLETEVVKSNLKEFADIAQKFISEFMKPSRLIITSRYGLGDREAKLPLNQFQLEMTRELVENYLSKDVLKEKEINERDWEWIQKYTSGNPGLIISFCNTLKSTRKKMVDLRVGYNTQYTAESRELHDQFEEFLVFCFENTIESMSLESQKFLATICYICSEANLLEINEEFLTYLKEEVGLVKLGDEHLRSTLFTNIGFLQPIPSSDKFYVNELFINYLDGSYSENVFNVFNLKKSEWFSTINELSQHINQIQFTDEVSIGKLLSELYMSKYKVNNENRFLIKSYFCEPDIDKLINIYTNYREKLDIYVSFEFLYKIEPLLKNKKFIDKQNRLLGIILYALIEINKDILKGSVNRIRQNDLKKCYRELEAIFPILNTNDLTVNNARLACKILTNFKEYSKIEKLALNKWELIEQLFKVYTKQVGEYSGKDKVKCSGYIEKCKTILKTNSTEISSYSKSQYIIYCARYYKKENLEKALKILEGYEEYYYSSNINTAIFYLECLLIRIECLIHIEEDSKVIENLINRYQKVFLEHQEKLFREKKVKLEEQFKKLNKKFNKSLVN